MTDPPIEPPAPGTPPLSAAAVAARLGGLTDDWIVRGMRLRRQYAVPDFASALAFVNRIGALAEGAGHHPDLALGWGRVEVELWTHDIGGLSEADFALAERIERAFTLLSDAE